MSLVLYTDGLRVQCPLGTACVHGGNFLSSWAFVVFPGFLMLSGTLLFAEK